MVKNYRNAICKQALKTTPCILGYQSKFGHFHPEDMFQLFDSMVKPILCYGAEIWEYEFKNRIEQVHAKFCRKYCNFPTKLVQCLP